MRCSAIRTLFARHDFVEASWALITPVHERWAADAAASIPTYEAGEWGAEEADRAAGARRPPLEDAVSTADVLLPDGVDTPFAEIEATMVRLASDELTGMARGRALASIATATVIAVGAAGPPRRCRGRIEVPRADRWHPRHPRRHRRAGRSSRARDGNRDRARRAARRSSSTTPLRRCACRACRPSSGGAAAIPRRRRMSSGSPTAWCSTPRIRRRCGRWSMRLPRKHR